MTLKELQIGKSAVVDTVGGSGALRQHFLDMGLIPGAEVTLRENLAVLAAICRTSDAIPPVLQAVESAGVPIHQLLRCAPGLLMIVNDSQYETALRSASVSK